MNIDIEWALSIGEMRDKQDFQRLKNAFYASFQSVADFVVAI